MPPPWVRQRLPVILHGQLPRLLRTLQRPATDASATRHSLRSSAPSLHMPFAPPCTAGCRHAAPCCTCTSWPPCRASRGRGLSAACCATWNAWPTQASPAPLLLLPRVARPSGAAISEVHACRAGSDWTGMPAVPHKQPAGAGSLPQRAAPFTWRPAALTHAGSSCGTAFSELCLRASLSPVVLPSPVSARSPAASLPTLAASALHTGQPACCKYSPLSTRWRQCSPAQHGQAPLLLQ